ncbi:glycoside hydrolase family 78 protein [Herbiconiux sp. CPCC 205716]|uniref:alpha-L-rhamnosidase n=1 Tax=Herbiconiux gentiana TaxID=2970912 RepID=A0ABT2GH08_9MICO|nr:alpha-L-rhamnosidase [Herbiconiux gentiana]MCS5715463.1 glycoside hydrolase family 78 protein [Herbiconiux gentiana]
MIPELSVEHLGDALGVGTATPRLSWKIAADPGWRQASYELEVDRGSGATRHLVHSDEQVLVPWPAEPLSSRERATVRVRVSAPDGDPSAWSAPLTVEAGLLDPLDWTATGIQPPWHEDHSDDDRRPPLFRHGFELDSDPRRARLYLTAHGLTEIEINGRRVGDDILAPGWTVYQDRLRTIVHDVTDHLVAGENAIGAWMADGWWRGRYGFDGGTLNIYGTDIALLAQLEVELEDGSVRVIGTNTDWVAHPSPIVKSSLYTGETFDAELVPDGWTQPGFDDSAWQAAKVAEFAPGTFVAPEGPPVRCTEELRPVDVRRTERGSVVLDFGQNFSGRLRVRAAAGVGERLVLRHAEVLQDGELYTRTLRDATSVDEYRGSTGSIDWEPRFTIHGFRYAEIEGYDGPLDRLDVVGRVYHSDMRRTGWLTTSHEGLNRLHENIRWSLRSNFVDIPMDCPQRDERLGWTGDIQVFTPTASFLYDCSGLLSSWLRDLSAEQKRFGTVPWYVPVIPGAPMWTPIQPAAVWGDAAVLTPWALWERFADRELLARQYPSAASWVDQVTRLAGPSRLWNTGMQLGDWLDPNAPPDDPALAVTDPYLVATAYFAWSAEKLADTAAALGHQADAERYHRLHLEIADAFTAEWGGDDRPLDDPTQTSLALAIAFGLLRDPARRAEAGDTLARLVREGGHRVGAGFAGVNLLSDALTATGHVETAFALLLEHGSPSWLSMVDKGATTIWERWDSLLDDLTVNPGNMTSFNHYALGSVADWMHRVIGGIEATAPGYRTVRIAPRPGPLGCASARFESAYGAITSDWTVVDGAFSLSVHLPTGVTGTVELPDGSAVAVGPGEHAFRTSVEAVPGVA